MKDLIELHTTYNLLLPFNPLIPGVHGKVKVLKSLKTLHFFVFTLIFHVKENTLLLFILKVLKMFSF